MKDESSKIKALNVKLNEKVAEYEESLKRNEVAFLLPMARINSFPSLSQQKLLKIIEENKVVHAKLQAFERSFETREKNIQNFYRTSLEGTLQARTSPGKPIRHTVSSQQKVRTSSQKKVRISPDLIDFPRKSTNSFTQQSASKQISTDFESKPSKLDDSRSRISLSNPLNFSMELKQTSSQKPPHYKSNLPLSRSLIEHKPLNGQDDSEDDDPYYMNPTKISHENILADISYLGEREYRADGDNIATKAADHELYGQEGMRRSYGGEESMHRPLRDSSEEDLHNSEEDEVLKDEILELDNEIALIQRTLAEEMKRNAAAI